MICIQRLKVKKLNSKLSITITGEPDFQKGNLEVLAEKTVYLIQSFWNKHDFHELDQLQIEYEGRIGPDKFFQKSKHIYYGFSTDVFNGLNSIFLENYFINASIVIKVLPPSIAELTEGHKKFLQIQA
jgi:hypothetical protein